VNYIQAFQEQRAKNVVEQVASKDIKDVDSFKRKFDTQKEKLSKPDLEAQYIDDTNELLDKAKKDNLDLNDSINQK
jgi:hypothetical protein